MHNPFAMGVLLMLIQASAQAALLVEGPIASGPVGNAAKDYPFSASSSDLAKAGYREDEFFVSGQGAVYNLPSLVTGGVLTDGHAYKTRVLVRRPVQATRFNGVVLVEWLNVTAGFDGAAVGNPLNEHLIRQGYAWVGVSAQETGVSGPLGLQHWNPQRYASLQVSTPKGPIVEDSPLAYDIFAQVGQALRQPPGNGTALLGGLQAKWLIATGASQSARRLAIYLNSVHPRQPVFDGALLVVSMGDRVRDDTPVKVAKILSESDLIGGDEANARQPDNSRRVTWEVAGASHSSRYGQAIRSQQVARDFPEQSLPSRNTAQTCRYQPNTPVPFHLVEAALLEHLRDWIANGTQPPSAPPLKVHSLLPQVELERDRWGNALGGIRLPDVEVPLARNSGALNPGLKPENNRLCRMGGIYEPFDKERLHTLYPQRADYLRHVENVLRDNVKAGFVLAEDVEPIIASHYLPALEGAQ
ncbi:alpha/beta hydrolase domain-containing protein [Pseudomonas sp. LRF_L74]|uniref:alpha/beta hydrolase domain-containing protein n=1 Tax=Pseudomonas sp. LRF_L74 TaxID=3369422 RepID=UPI003F5E0DDF